jgi:hypothetical protein
MSMAATIEAPCACEVDGQPTGQIELPGGGAVVPCSTHNPAMFDRWVHGCYRPDHDRRRCRHCGPRST